MNFYSQWNEDRVIAKVFNKEYKGFFVDVGAYDGVNYSNTLAFEEQGWNGICIEPHTTFFEELTRNRKCLCLNIGVWERNLDDAKFYATRNGIYSRALSEVSDEALRHVGHFRNPIHSILKKNLRTLDFILEKHRAPKRFELLSVDVEGTEWNILKGLTLEKWQPRIVVIEYTFGPYYDSYFKNYHLVESGSRWRTGTMDSANLFYCREKQDAEVIIKHWRN